jgi:hypothetical protein
MFRRIPLAVGWFGLLAAISVRWFAGDWIRSSEALADAANFAWLRKDTDLGFMGMEVLYGHIGNAQERRLNKTPWIIRPRRRCRGAGTSA